MQTPKSRAGVRTILQPVFVTESLRDHLKDYFPLGPDGPLPDEVEFLNTELMA